MFLFLKYMDCSPKSIVFPEVMTKIQSHAIDACESLRTIIFPNILTTIVLSAFWCLTNLKEIYIPANVERIDDFPFQYCLKLRKITVDKDNSYYDSRNDCNAIIEYKTDRLIKGCRNI
jgi:hypothetical protein